MGVRVFTIPAVHAQDYAIHLLRRQAKDLCNRWRSGDDIALSMVQAVWRNPVEPSLQRAQHVVAHACGWSSWDEALVHHGYRERLDDRCRSYRRGWHLPYPMGIGEPASATSHPWLINLIPCGRMIKPGSITDMHVLGWRANDPFWDACEVSGDWDDAMLKGWPQGPHAPGDVPPGVVLHNRRMRKHMESIPDGPAGIIRTRPGHGTLITGGIGSGKSHLVRQILDSMSMVRPMILWQRHGLHDGIRHERWASAYTHHRFLGGDATEVIPAMRAASTPGTLVVIDGVHEGEVEAITRPFLEQGMAVIVAGQMDLWNGCDVDQMKASMETVVAFKNPWCPHAPMMRMPHGHAVIIAGDHRHAMRVSDIQHVEIGSGS